MDMLRKNLFSVLDSPARRWLGIALLLVVVLTPLVVHNLTSKKAHAATDVSLVMHNGFSSVPIYSVQVSESLPTGIARPCITDHFDHFPVPQGTQIEVLPALDGQCQQFLGGQIPLPQYPQFPNGYADQRINFNVGTATSCDVAFFAKENGGTAHSAPIYACK
jgi:hypothetical protein